MTTVLSVNGEDGTTLARSSGIRLIQDDSQALVRFTEDPRTRNGNPGQNAPRAIRGGPAGTLVLQLSESRISQGAIRVERVEYRSVHSLPQDLEVPIGRELQITAIGGQGEPGQNGGNGQQGLGGVQGTDASKASDATDGSDGGRGGDAGQGANGGDGGPGGAIHIVLHENSTHLLMAVSCDVKGGHGGAAGTHGNPGEGGKGGTGGKGWRWDEIVGYKPYCTDSCIKDHNHATQSTALTQARTHLNATSSALIAQTGALLVSGDNLQHMIVQAATRYNARRQSGRDTGACKCGGGTGSCAGCDVKPIIKTFQRAPGLDGRDGQNGLAINTTLIPGRRGEEGTVTIAVHHDDGSVQQYSSPWSLELIDFEVEDENGDGIFEPGEHVFIRRIKVRNSGGMPSPTCQIPVMLANCSDWFEAVPGYEGGVTFLPTSIPAGESASTEGSIKVRIKESAYGADRQPRPGVVFSTKDTLSIRADMPWLERRLRSFEVTKEVTISYPSSLNNTRYLKTIAQGASSNIHYQVQNLSSRPLGHSAGPDTQRAAEVRVTIPEHSGRLVAEEQVLEVIQPIPAIRPRDAIVMQQQYRVLSTAKSHTRFPITLELYLSSPLQDENSDVLEMVLVERHVIHLQVSNTYTQSPNSGLLLVTNPKTSEQQSQAFQQFVRNDLRLEMDLCNVHQNGGLLVVSDEFDNPRPIFSVYGEKAIVVLDNSFEFLNAQSRTTSQLCDPRWLFELAMNQGSILFSGCENDQAFQQAVRSAALSLPIRLEDAMKEVRRSRLFSNPQDLVDSVIQERVVGTIRTSLSAIAIGPRQWYHFGRDQSKKRAKDLAKYLRNRLPNERFLVSFVAATHKTLDQSLESSIDDMLKEFSDMGYLIVATGLNHQASFISTESAMTVKQPYANATISSLDDLSKYSIIAALPISQRMAWLWQGKLSEAFLTKACALSVAQNSLQQISNFLRSRHKLSTRVDSKNSKAIGNFFKTHLPCLDTIFASAEAEAALQAPEAVLEVLRWVLSLTSTVRRHRTLHTLIQAMINHGRGAKYHGLIESHEKHTSQQTSPQEALVKEISQLTKAPEYTFTKGQMCTNDVSSQTRYYAPAEWDKMVRSVEQWRERLFHDMDGARKELDRMLVGYSPPETAELSTGD